MLEDADPTFQRLEHQISWYSRKSTANQRNFKLVKAAQLLAAATIPVVATTSPPRGRMRGGPTPTPSSPTGSRG